MSELIDRIPGVESMISKLRGVVNTSQQIKARQRLTGRSGQLAYTAQSSNEWDLTEALTPPTPPAFSEARYRIVFTGDGTQLHPIVFPLTDIRINGTGDGNRLQPVASSGLYAYQDGSGEVLGQAFIDELNPDYFGSDYQLAWEFYFQYAGSVTVRIKARAQASCQGSFTITRII
jgi:hypothetical protein